VVAPLLRGGALLQCFRLAALRRRAPLIVYCCIPGAKSAIAYGCAVTGEAGAQGVSEIIKERVATLFVDYLLACSYHYN